MRSTKQILLGMSVLLLFAVAKLLSAVFSFQKTLDDVITFQYDTLYVEALGKTFRLHGLVTEYQRQADTGGNTSVRNMSSEELEWKTQGYYQRNRDLGQVFIPKKNTRVKSIVLRTGPAASAVLHGAPGSKVFMQFFEIIGDPVINDNGTPKGTPATHGFTTNHRADDFIEGVEYKSLPTIYVGVFPNIPITKDAQGNMVGNAGNLYYMRWRFENPIFFEANKRYGFVVGFLDEGAGLGFTLANVNLAAISDEPSLNDRHTPYKGGWCFRREGDGTLPPTLYPGENPPESDALVQLLKSESLFPPSSNRFRLSPTSDGYPDVDTYRAYEFYIEEEIAGNVAIELNDDELALEAGREYSLKLIQNYPNPFNPSTTIRFSIPEQSHVTLAIYDLLGREMAVLINDELAAGTYQQVFDASHLSSGVYLYQLRAGERIETKRLMLVK